MREGLSVLIERPNTPHELDEDGMRLHDEKKDKYASEEEFRLTSYGTTPLCAMHREVAVATFASVTRAMYQESRILCVEAQGASIPTLLRHLPIVLRAGSSSGVRCGS